MQALYFDMDGTIANLYNVEGWESKLRAEDPSPYADASPLVDMVRLAAIIAKLRKAWRNGDTIDATASDELLEKLQKVLARIAA